ncbi:MAG TPA: hypothetical protein VD930_09370 [Gemmatimonadales bacterium]|nr:hypothetical protein [Gemmatimonadales bacterium]
MSHCTWLSDRMPLVALGRAEWTGQEVEHLSACRSCQQEWELLRATIRLGDHAAAGMDAGSLARTLEQRLESSIRQRRQRRAWSFAGMAAAAAIAGLLWTGRADPPLTPQSPAAIVAGLQIPLPELEELQPAELDSVLRAMEQTGPYLDTLETGDAVGEEGPALETVYDYWEG